MIPSAPDWELDYYSRPILEADGKKRWELLICSTGEPERADPFRWAQDCPATSVNSQWLRGAIEAALEASRAQGYGMPRRLRCWRSSMRTMVQRAAEGLGLELVPSRRCYSLVEWLMDRQVNVYPHEPGYMRGPLAPPPAPVPAVAIPLPEAARGDSWSWATTPASSLLEAGAWEIAFPGLVPLPVLAEPDMAVPGIRLYSRRRALAIAAWLSGLEPVRLDIDSGQLVLEAGLEDRWILARLEEAEADAAAQAFAASREQAGGLQFIAVQSDEASQRLDGFWLLRDLPDG